MQRETLCKPWEHRLSRRQLLGGVLGAGAAAGASLAGAGPLFRPAVGEELRRKRRQVLFIWLDGGISQLESWDPKPDTRFGGPFRAIRTSVPGVHVCELLPKTARQMHHLAIVRSLCTKDNSHSAGVARIQRGDPKNRGVPYPFLGSAVARLVGDGGTGLPPYVWIKPGSGGFIHQDAGFLGPKYGAVAFGDGKPPENLLRPESVDDAADAERNRLRSAAEQRYARGRRPGAVEANSAVYDMARELMRRKEIFDTASLPAKDVQRYGTHDFGRHMLTARRMLEAGVTFVKVASYGWDTHGDTVNGHSSLVPQVAQACSARMEELGASGLLDQVLVILMSEFGRTPRINGHVGRDHWPEAWSAAMAGCGLNRGVVVGKTNDLGTFVSSEEHDIGHMFHTWFRALGIDPKTTEYDNHGQPLPIAHDECRPVKELLA